MIEFQLKGSLYLRVLFSISIWKISNFLFEIFHIWKFQIFCLKCFVFHFISIISLALTLFLKNGYANETGSGEILLCEQQQRKNNPCDVSAITKLIKKFETTFTLHDKPKSGRPSLNEERKNLVSEAVDDTANEFGATSIRRLSSETGIPKSSTHRIARNILKLYPFKIQMLQELHPSNKINRLEFCAWLRNNEEKLPTIISSDEANIHLDGSISRYHCRI